MAFIEKYQVVERLAQDYGLFLKNTRGLNKIMEEMGFIIKYGNGWSTTKKGAPYCFGNIQIFNNTSWDDSIVKIIATYINSK